MGLISIANSWRLELPVPYRVLWLALLLSVAAHVGMVILWPGFVFSGKEGQSSLQGRLKSIVLTERVSPVKAASSLAQPPAEVRTVRAGNGVVSMQSGMPGGRAAKVSGAGRAKGAAEDYIPVELLGSRPVFLVRPESLFPEGAPPAGHGRVVLQLLVSAGGAVDGIIVESSEFSAELTQRLVDRLRAAPLSAGTMDGKPVKSRWRMEFKLDPDSSSEN